MRDVNGSNFVLLADPGDWTVEQGVAWNGHAYALAGKQRLAAAGDHDAHQRFGRAGRDLAHGG